MSKSSAKPDIIEQHWSHVIQHLFRSLPSSSENCSFPEPQKPLACETEEPPNSNSFRPSYSLYCERNSPSEAASVDKENVDNGLSRLIRELVIEAPQIGCAGTQHYISEAGAIRVPGGERRTRRRTPPPLNEENDDLAPLLEAQEGSSSDDEGGHEDSEPEVEDEEVDEEESESDEEGLNLDEAIESKLVPLGERKKIAKAKKLKSEAGEGASTEKQSSSQDADSEHSSDEEDKQVPEKHTKRVIRKRRNTDDDDDSQGGRSAKEQLLAA
ncbi:hypothetical protein CAEBREN_14250 [Caenorhabditis brenneri]|uniref:Uncharacterized protein n=1 Tax=Caenorhabditis brenneri TaxID=135651 RepID=G0NM20_CAEBE|nr:hypothetical protein CAEBREN_14250 [Caenorhabditis brenneri]